MRLFILPLTLAIGLGLVGSVAPAAAAGGEKDKAKSPPVTKTVEGKLQAMDLQKGMLTLKKGQKESVTVRLTTDTKVRIDGKAGSPKQLMPGDVLAVTYEIRRDGNVAQLVVLNRPR